jgi:hypothetical protein
MYIFRNRSNLKEDRILKFDGLIESPSKRNQTGCHAGQDDHDGQAD